MKKSFFSVVFTTFLIFFNNAGWADDIDLFVQPQTGASDLPNVLIVVDNTGNWSSPFPSEIAALKSTLDGISVNSDGTAKFRVGIMFYAETGNPNNNVSGGYVRAAIRPMTTENKSKYSAMINTLDSNRDKGNAGVSSLAMAEAYRYFSGGAPYAGNGKVKTDFTGNVCAECSNSDSTSLSRQAMSNIFAIEKNALLSKNATKYQNPFAEGCAKNFIIFISNGPNQDSSSTITTATAMLKSAGGNTKAIPVSPSGSMDTVADEWARFMYSSSLGIVTYTIDVDKSSTGQGPGWTALLKSMASVSSGKYFDVKSGNNGAEIKIALETALSEIQAVNSVFASVSLPVSVNTQGTYLNQVFIGMFRPDVMPRWAGNLKQYKLGLVGNSLKTLDADGASAINSSTGFIAECSRSYWTPNSIDSYWENRPKGNCIAVADSAASNYPDGNIVEKGAQAHKLRNQANRTLKTCSSSFSDCTSIIDFNTTTVTSLPSVTSTNLSSTINWQNGFNVDAELNKSTTIMRPSTHGDVVHSRPVAVDIGSENAAKVVVFYGGNDGVLRVVNGNRDGGSSIHNKGPGEELWSFIAPEFYSQISRLRSNSVSVTYKGTTATSHASKPYGFDGPLSAYQGDSNLWIYATMRRGGRVLYAFDFGSLTGNTFNPTLKWKKGCPNLDNDNDCSSGFSGIGQTWSSAKSLRASGYGSGKSPMLIMGGGYDKCEDADPNTCSASSKGKHVYLLDADTGNLLKTFETDRPVVADVFVVNNTAGLAMWAYVVDLGGNIYRISGNSANSPIGTTAPNSWTMTKIASLGCDNSASCQNNRKFMYAPDIVEQNGTYYLLLGSGDREKPISSYTAAYSVKNYFFMVKDTPTASTWLSSEYENCGANIICKESLLGITGSSSPTLTEVAAKKGWYLGLETGEQVVTTAITVYGVTTFSTHSPTIPVAGACTSTLGTARVYNIQYSNAESANGTLNRAEVIIGGGLPPSPVAGMVKLDSGETVPFIIGASPTSALESKQPDPSVISSQPKGRAYWYIQQ